MKLAFAWSAFSLGAMVCFLNFYLSFLRHPLMRLRGISPGHRHWVSGIPMLGTLLVGFSLIGLHDRPVILAAAIVLLALDTCGPLWFVIMTVYWSFKKNGK